MMFPQMIHNRPSLQFSATPNDISEKTIQLDDYPLCGLKQNQVFALQKGQEALHRFEVSAVLHYGDKPIVVLTDTRDNRKQHALFLDQKMPLDKITKNGKNATLKFIKSEGRYQEQTFDFSIGNAEGWTVTREADTDRLANGQYDGRFYRRADRR